MNGNGSKIKYGFLNYVIKQKDGVPSAQRLVLVDLKGIAKPSTYNRVMKLWGDWSFKYTNFLASAHADARALLEWAAASEAAIEDFDEIQGTDCIELSGQIYASLAQLVEGEALGIVRNTSQGNGAEAWRRLSKRFDPQTVSRKRGAMAQILMPGSFKYSELSSAIERWEEKVRIYEGRSKGQVQDDVRCGVVIEMCPDKLKEHLYMSSSKLSSYVEIKREIVTFLETQHVKSEIKDTSGPMDIGSVFEGKSKGNKGKGKRRRKSPQCRKPPVLPLRKAGALVPGLLAERRERKGQGKIQRKKEKTKTSKGSATSVAGGGTKPPSAHAARARARAKERKENPSTPWRKTSRTPSHPT
jgi:hypothetical protein